MRNFYAFSKEVVLMLLLFLMVHFTALGQDVTISGTVKDIGGEPLVSVTITVVGTTRGTISDLNGNYELTAPSNGQLKFQFIGFIPQIVDINGRNNIDVALKADVIGLEEVVVVGYGVQKKSDITGAITSVDIEKLRDVPSFDITKSLQGKAAGLEIQKTSTRPGGDTQIRIRGNRSLSASNDPLIVVDGIPYGGRLSDISSDNIASIEVLKDASATVIYGSRGANGVIIITTKRGNAGKLQVTYNGYEGLSTVTRKYDVFSGEELVKLRTVANYTYYLPDEKESMLLGRETDWQDLMYENGIISSHELGLSGGTAQTQYAMSLGYFNETGILPGLEYTRYNMRMSLDQSIGKYVKVGLTTMNSYALTEGQSASMMWEIISMSPLSVPYNPDGTVKLQPAYDRDLDYNPLTIKDGTGWEERNRRVSSFNTLFAEINFTPELKYRLNIGIDFSEEKYNNFFGSETKWKQGGTNSARVQHRDNLSYTIENMVTYDKTFNDAHRLNVTGMYSAQESKTTSSRFDANGVPVDYLQYHNLSLADMVIAPSDNNYYSKWSLMSYMMRVNYAYKDKYLLTLSGRADGSSRLAKGNKWHYYPAFALGWNVINENFMADQSTISNLKLRFGYGQTSNTSINPYSTLGGLSTNLYSLGDQGYKGYYVSSLPNKELGWEFTKSTNLGIDFALFEGYLSGAVDVYLQKTNDLLLAKQLPPSQGVPGSYYENVGKTKNKGLEVVLNGIIFNPKTERDFSWDISANLFLNREKIVALQDPGITQDIGNGWFVGHPASAVYDYVKLGIWQLDEAAEAAQYGREPGDIKLLDFAGGGANGDEPDGQITDADRRVIGSGQPDFQGGFTSTWKYKGFDLSVVGYFRVGSTIVSTLHMPGDYVNRLDGRRNGIKVDYWTPDNPTNDMPKPDAAIDASYTSTLGYFSGSFLKIRSINLGYNLNKNMTRFLGEGSSVRIYTTVTDPFTLFSSYIDAGGVDPEPNKQSASVSGGEGVPARALKIGLDTPPTSSFIIGLNVKF
jgi:TonB-linked SusC/RagA family outer membrane protein